MEIPWKELDPLTLERLLSEIVTRDGTDYGFHETSTEARIKSVRRSLESGSALLLWDEESESAAIVTREKLQQEKRDEDRLRREAGKVSEQSEET